MFRWLLAPLDHRPSLGDRDVKHAHLARGGEVADAAALERIELRARPHGDGRQGILEAEPAAREVGVGVTGQFQDDRVHDPAEPDSSAYDAFGAIVDLTADHAVLDAPGHVNVFTMDEWERKERSNRAVSPASCRCRSRI
jgi:hypothetical protein